MSINRHGNHLGQDDLAPVITDQDIKIHVVTKTPDIQPYASPFKRFFAAAVDYLLLSVLAATACIFLLGLRASMAQLQVLLLIPAILYLIPFTYFVIGEGFFQTTMGKYLLDLKVARSDGSRIGIFRAFVRNIAKSFSAGPFFLGLVTAFFTERRQSLHDFLLDTIVMDTPTNEPKKRYAVVLAFASAGYLTFAGTKIVYGVQKKIRTMSQEIAATTDLQPTVRPVDRFRMEPMSQTDFEAVLSKRLSAFGPFRLHTTGVFPESLWLEIETTPLPHLQFGTTPVAIRIATIKTVDGANIYDSSNSLEAPPFHRVGMKFRKEGLVGTRSVRLSKSVKEDQIAEISGTVILNLPVNHRELPIASTDINAPKAFGAHRVTVTQFKGDAISTVVDGPQQEFLGMVGTDAGGKPLPVSQSTNQRSPSSAASTYRFQGQPTGAKLIFSSTTMKLEYAFVLKK